MKNLNIRVMTENDAKEIVLWKYEEPYSCYNYPNWEFIVKEKWFITIPEKREKTSYTIFRKNEIIAGIHLREIDNNLVLGLESNPKYCGKGIGNVVLTFAKELASKSNLDLTLKVKSFNIRAIKCYEKNGFEIENSFIENNNKFYFMRLKKK